MIQVFGPKPEQSPSVGRPCPLCGSTFKPGDYTTVIESDTSPMGDETHYNCLVLVLNGEVS